MKPIISPEYFKNWAKENILADWKMPFCFEMMRPNKCFGYKVIVDVQEIDADRKKQDYFRVCLASNIAYDHLTLYDILCLCDFYTKTLKFKVFKSTTSFIRLDVDAAMVNKGAVVKTLLLHRRNRRESSLTSCETRYGIIVLYYHCDVFWF